jgi:superfamily II DNA helicase RecQ
MVQLIKSFLLMEEMNAFLRSKKILKVESQMVSDEQGAFWCFCVRYLLGSLPASRANSATRKKEKVDYKEVLDTAAFDRFSEMRVIRKQIAQDEAIPAYAVFTDAELAELAKMEGVLSLAKMKTVKGIGEKKIEKYGQQFLPKPVTNEASK